MMGRAYKYEELNAMLSRKMRLAMREQWAREFGEPPLWCVLGVYLMRASEGHQKPISKGEVSCYIMDKPTNGKPPLFGYMMNALRDELEPEARRKALTDFKALHGEVQGEDIGKAFAKFFTDRVAARAEKARDEDCG